MVSAKEAMRAQAAAHLLPPARPQATVGHNAEAVGVVIVKIVVGIKPSWGWDSSEAGVWGADCMSYTPDAASHL